jgi:uncharacterized protein (DUF488 family)
MSGPRIFSIGHSTRPIEELIGLLRANGVRTLVDIRSIRGSRRNPQFGEAALARSMKTAGVQYVVLPSLGGRRAAHRDSPNSGWRNDSFRGYADYMQTPDFARGLDALIQLADKDSIAIMCAEAVPWRCHRSLVADALLVRGVQVRHIITAGEPHEHNLTRFARVDGIRITYPASGENRS